MLILTGQTLVQLPFMVDAYGSALYLRRLKVGSMMTPIGPEYVAPYDRPPLRRYTGQVFMQAPQRMHLSDVQKSAMPSRSERPLSTSTTCISPPARGTRKCDVICVMGEPSALRDSMRTNTPRCSIFGISFSMPMEAMCSFGTFALRSALPSLVHTTKLPVSATAKLAAVSPATSGAR